MTLISYRNNGGSIAFGITALSKGRTIEVFPIIFRNGKKISEESPENWNISEIKLSKMKFLNIIHIEPSQIEQVIDIDYDDFVRIFDKLNYR